MSVEHIAIEGGSPGTNHHIAVHRFGRPGARPRAYVQGGLHANEAPGMLTAAHLVGLLANAEIVGEVIVVPAANPLGLGQRVLGQSVGRFSLTDGRNYNRGFPLLVPEDAPADAAGVRAALLRAVEAWSATTPEEKLRRTLLWLAIDADLVLDLHCDGEAPPHLYALTPQAADAAPLAALLGARALLLADDSGDDPFDEACSRPWAELRRKHPDLSLGCVAMTVELRGLADVGHAFAASDAAAVLDYLKLRGVVAGDAPVVPAPRCAATPLAGVDWPKAPIAGVLIHVAELDASVTAGDVVAEVLDPIANRTEIVRAGASGILFARTAARVVAAGQRICKIAGAQPRREGLLLSP